MELNPHTSTASNPESPKGVAAKFIDHNLDAVSKLNDAVFFFGELGMQEYETAQLMTDILAKAGFEVERGISGFPTAFCASFGSGSPVIAVHTEYDANPDNSQQPGIAEQKPIVEGAPGHCEGHNVNAAVLVAGALAAREAMQALKLPGTLKVFGAPAEEQLISRPYMVRDGWFDNVDICITPHIASEFRVGYGLIQSALISALFSFFGESAHAGVAPWKGRDALDAAVLMDTGMAHYREHMKPGMRCQRVISEGGKQPNLVPSVATIWWYLRAASADEVLQLFKQTSKIAEGAALMSNTECKSSILSAAWPVRGNRTVAEVVESNYLHLGEPAWSSCEQDLARLVQARVGVAQDGLSSEPARITGPAVQRPSANDAGDISWKVPHAKLFFPGNIPNISNHHWSAGVALATSIAHKGAASGAKVLAGSILDFLLNSSLVDEACATFEEEISGVEFRTLLPSDQHPPIHLNAETMSVFRPMMRQHYLKVLPEFSSTTSQTE